MPGLMSGHKEILIEGRDPNAPREEVARAAIDDGFAATYGLRAISGRLPDARDTADSLPVAAVDQRFAERYWPGGIRCSAASSSARTRPRPGSPWSGWCAT